MNSILTIISGHLSERPLTTRGIAQPVPGKTRTAGRESEPRLWKLTSTIISPVQRGFETSLFLIASSFGIGATVWGMGQLVAFIHSDSLGRTITALIR